MKKYKWFIIAAVMVLSLAGCRCRNEEPAANDTQHSDEGSMVASVCVKTEKEYGITNIGISASVNGETVHSSGTCNADYSPVKEAVFRFDEQMLKTDNPEEVIFTVYVSMDRGRSDTEIGSFRISSSEHTDTRNISIVRTEAGFIVTSDSPDVIIAE